MTMSHMHSSSVFLFFLIMILVIIYQLKCEARDSINVRNPLSDNNETLVSAGKRFELGFFTPEGNEKSSKYVGIWYYELIPRTIVWVANRDKPILDSCGLFGIADDGNIKLWCSNGVSVPVTSLDSGETSNRTLQLLDSGNLIFVGGQSREKLWQSFDDPTDTFLPGMKLTDDVKLTSWISQIDPGTGNYMFRQDQGGFSIQKGSAFYWKIGRPGTSTINNNLPSFVSQLLLDSATGFDPKTVRKKNRSISYSNHTTNNTYDSRLVMSSSGEVQYFHKFEYWTLLWSKPEDKCGINSVCGKSAVCNMEWEPICQCPPGFKPSYSEDCKAGQYSEGCDRETKCGEQCNNLQLLLMVKRGESVKFGKAPREENCKEECLHNCKCKAYTSVEFGAHTSKCWIWTDEIEKQGYNDNMSVPLSTVERKPPKNKSRKRYVIVITVIVAGVILVIFSSYILYQRRRRAAPSGNQGSARDTPALFSNERERRVNELIHESDKLIDVPFYNLDIILSATDNFSDANKLGQGGFGPVYKGKFPGGQEFAVKRMSSCSGQGIEEFLNEVVLIAKLQHRNLVRLLGYCIKETEKILLYEYMPNRSLDAFIFDQHNCLLLDWKKRFDIILGIARGLLYLHQDSRLRIIHRDLKTSNILLDEDMNPKISDFGLARIIEGKGSEASTNKVVGTYGYMSPEYALDGKFSVKSDVFSFGVVVLEIISGKKNTGFYSPYEVLNLVGYTWRLWNENKALDLLDPSLLESCEKSQVMKCINIGLLSVQEDPNERPSMSTVVIMLGSETNPLPHPTQPAFVVRRRLSTGSSSSSTKPDMISKNELTISMAQGR